MIDLIYLLLKPLLPWFDIAGLIEISIVEPQFICLEIEDRGYIRKEAPDLTYDYWEKTLFALANVNGVYFDVFNQPKLSIILPGEHRLEAMLGNHVDKKISISIRMKKFNQKKITDFGINSELADWLIGTVQQGCNCVISGGTSSGKTTFLNTLLSYIPASKRILTVEDTRELFFKNNDFSCHYILNRNEKNTNIGYQEVIDHIVRSRPDVLIVGEISVANAYAVLRLLNSGHRGFFCTIHANDASSAIQWAFPQNVQLSGIEPAHVVGWLTNALDLVVQLGSQPKVKYVKEIYEPKCNKVIYSA